ncbi:TPA: restriction endonuclease subunit S [Streptococcus suis]
MTRMKDSGIEWIGEVPEEWGVGNLKYYFDVQLGKMLQTSAVNGNDIEIDYLRAINVQWDNISVENLSKMWCNPSEVGKYEIKNGDLLVCEGGEVGRCGIVEHLSDRAIIQNAVHRIRPTEKADVRFLNYYIQHTTKSKWFDILCNKATIAHLTSEKLLNTSVVLPSISEQTQIADFLDKKVAQLDKVKSLLEEQIKTLEDYRQSLIYETVTKGLDKTVPLKDSGVDWIGQIPEGWEITRLKYICGMQSGNNLTSLEISSENDGGKIFPVYGGNGQRGYYSDFTNEGNYCLVGRQGALAGNIHFVSGKFWATDHAIVVYEHTHTYSKYLYYLLKVMNLNQYAFETSAQPGLSVEKILQLETIHCPKGEQSQIADFLDKKTEQINQMIAIKKEQIENINKQRQTLIYDYVTGKRRV